MGKYKFDWDGLKDKITKEEKEKKKTFEKDTRFWRHTTDEQGKGVAVIRFIPDKKGNPFVKYYSHSFDFMVDGVKKFWIKKCINTFGYDQDCPICKKNMEYWNSVHPKDKKIASLRKRKLEFVSNIIVIKNPAHPEDEGKVFLYRFGQKIYEKMKALMFPSEEDQLDPDFKSFMPFDLEEGADFLLKVKKQGEFPNYDDSKFGSQKKIGSDEEIDKIMEMTYDIEELISLDKFPTNLETIKALGHILGITYVNIEDDTPKSSKKSNEVETKELDEISSDDDSIDEDNSIDDDAMFFENLA